MANKNKSDRNGFVYSTDPNFKFEQEDENIETLKPSEQKLRVWLDTKIKGGKTATVVKDFIGQEVDMNDLGKKLKTHCGTGGNVKDGEIIIQGDQREKVLQWLLKNGYSNSKKAG
ncbi:MAG: translation initiation factor [Pseudopedobacter saltans]|uniref:Translation initiation factor n=1 Tax=Pseudopedobacter saltans TaxID=151895 RepID=A0A2W5ES99_9SPHI|nr:MAG: translation initiation factor [Pseudopedobacter saltans]